MTSPSPSRQRCRWGGLLLPPTLNFFWSFFFIFLTCRANYLLWHRTCENRHRRHKQKSSAECTLSLEAKTQPVQPPPPAPRPPSAFWKVFANRLRLLCCHLCCYLCCLHCYCCPSSTAAYLAPALGCAVWAPGVNFLHGNFSFCSPFLSAPVRDGNNESRQQQE